MGIEMVNKITKKWIDILPARLAANLHLRHFRCAMCNYLRVELDKLRQLHTKPNPTVIRLHYL